MTSIILKEESLIMMNCKIVIRQMNDADPQLITDEEIKQGWNQSVKKYQKRLKDMSEGKCISLVAEYEGDVAGYINLYFNRTEGPFKNLPEIVDFGVLEKFRNKGIGTALMDEVEKLALDISDIVYLGVGLHSGYGSAQRMYVKRGYIPDGSGVWYQGKQLEQYAPCCNDDDLLLFLAKKLF